MIHDCSGLKSLPEGLSVGGDLDLSHCPHLAPPPEVIEVAGMLSIEGCGVIEDYYCSNPERIRGLPAICGSLQLVDWEGLTSLPTGLVLEDLRIEYCDNLAWLPAGLIIENDLSLHGCEKLMWLPEDLYVGGNLFVPFHLFDRAGALKDRGQVGHEVVSILHEQGNLARLYTHR